MVCCQCATDWTTDYSASDDRFGLELNPINPRSKKLSGETNVDCICAYTAQDSLQQEIIRDNNCARQAQRNPTTHNKNP